MPADQGPPENPPADKETEADRLRRAPVLLWAILGGLAMIGFGLLLAVLPR